MVSTVCRADSLVSTRVRRWPPKPIGHLFVCPQLTYDYAYQLKSSADLTTCVVTLQELSELLSISTEDTLAGSFQVNTFLRKLVKILGGTGNANDDGDNDDDSHEPDEDAQLAVALVLSGGGQYQGDDDLEAQVLAAHCLANLMEALPGVAHTVVYHGAIPVLCSKLIEISYIDLAEPTLSVRPASLCHCVYLQITL